MEAAGALSPLLWPALLPALRGDTFWAWARSSRCRSTPSSSVLKDLAGCVIAGLLAGCLSSLLTLAVYAAEDSFMKLPIHWKWWPAIGGNCDRIGRTDLSASARRGLRHDPIAPARRCAACSDSWGSCSSSPQFG